MGRTPGSSTAGRIHLGEPTVVLDLSSAQPLESRSAYHKPAEARVLGLVHHTHPTAASFSTMR
jgi:hypothetical protein